MDVSAWTTRLFLSLAALLPSTCGSEMNWCKMWAENSTDMPTHTTMLTSENALSLSPGSGVASFDSGITPRSSTTDIVMTTTRQSEERQLSAKIKVWFG